MRGRGGRRRRGRTRPPGMPGARNATASEAPSRPTSSASSTFASASDWCSATTYSLSLATYARLALEHDLDGDVVDRADRPARIASGILAREVADVDVDDAGVGHLVERVAALDPAEVDRRGGRSSSQLCRANGSDSMLRKTSIALRTALSPSHGVDPWAAVPLTVRRSASTPLACDADVQVGRLAGDREVAAVAALDQDVGAADRPPPRTPRRRRRRSRTSHPVLIAQIAQRAHHRRERRPSCRRRRGRSGRSPSTRGSNCPGLPGTTSMCPWSTSVGGVRPGRPRRRRPAARGSRAGGSRCPAPRASP